MVRYCFAQKKEHTWAVEWLTNPSVKSTDLALRRTKMRPGDDYTKVDSWKDTDGRKVVDDLAAAMLRRLGLAVYWKGLLWAAFATVLIVALPPGYGT